MRWTEAGRRSVGRDLGPWPGWPKFLKFLDLCEVARFPEDSRLYFVVLFITGGREAEVVQYRPEMFRYNDYAVLAEYAPMVKNKQITTRTILVPRDDKNPLVEDFVKYLKACNTMYLLPARKRYSREIIPDEPISRRTVYNRISEISPDLWPHAIRGYRAKMLNRERGFLTADLVSWFEWTNPKTAMNYTREHLDGLARTMNIKELPI